MTKEISALSLMTVVWQYKGCILQLQAPAILNPVDPNTYTITNKDEDTVVYVKYVADSEDKSEYEVFYYKLVK